MNVSKSLRLGLDHLPECNSDCPTCRLSVELSPSALTEFVKLCADFYSVSQEDVYMACAVNRKTPVSALERALSSAAVRKLLDTPLFSDVGSILDQPVAALADLPGFREGWIVELLQLLKKHKLYDGPEETEKGKPERYIPLKDLHLLKLEDSVKG